MANENAEDRDSVEEPDDAAPAAKAEPKKPTVRTNDDDGSVSVELHDEEPAQDRKARRGGRQAEEVARLRQEAEEARAEVQRLRQESAQRFQQIEQRVAQPTGDPYKDKIAGIRSEQESIQTLIRSGTIQDPNQVEGLRKRFYALNDEQEALAEERIVNRARETIRRESQPQQGQGEEAIMRAEFPDVVPAQGAQPTAQQLKALRWAAAEYQRRTAEDEPATLVTSRKAMQDAAVKFGFRQQAVPPASRTEQQRFGAVSGQAGPRNGGSEMRLSPKDMELATARWPDIEPKEAYAKLAAVLRRAERTEQGLSE